MLYVVSPTWLRRVITGETVVDLIGQSPGIVSEVRMLTWILDGRNCDKENADAETIVGQGKHVAHIHIDSLLLYL